MSTLSHPAGLPWLMPYITVLDVEQAAHFYQKAFKFEIKEMVPGEDKTTWFAELTYKDQLIMLGKQGAWGKTSQSPADSKLECPMGLFLYCEDVDQFYQDAVKNGAQGIEPPQDMFWGDRMCRLQDLDGYIWSFATYLGQHK